MNRDWVPSQWLHSFDDMLDSELDTADQWTLSFNYSQTNIISTEEQRRGWRVYKHWASGRFCCGRCSRRWNSHNVVVLFRYRLRSGDRHGTVTMRPYGQACQRCPGHGFVLPGFKEEEVMDALVKLFAKIQRTCYEEGAHDDDEEEDERLMSRHQAALCQACREGICAGPVNTFAWVVSSVGYAAQAQQHQAGYVLAKLSVSEQEKRKIEADTVGQHRNPLWSAYRKKRITSSNFGLVLKAVERQSRMSSPYPASLFNTLQDRYPLKTRSKAIKWGIRHEPRAKQQYMQRTGLRIQERGVFLSASGLLGASPDGTVSGGDRIVEVKCPWSAREKTVRLAAAEIRDFFLQVDEVTGALTLKQHHNYWHQIQGTLHLSGASSCDLVIWTPHDIVILQVLKDPTWAENISILETFYRNVFLPHVLSETDVVMKQSEQMEMKSMDQTSTPTFPPGDKETIPLQGEMEAHPVTESRSSPHSSLELQDETDLSSCFSGLRIEEFISLPRSHSLPSLIPCLANKTGFRAERCHSLNDVTLLGKTQKITPDIIVVENQEIYRFHSTQAGLFQCSVTDLGFKMEAEGDVTYRTVPWHRRLLSQLDKRPAGPLFDIKGSQGAVCQLCFPHCEILSTGAGKFLSVVHVKDDDGFELIKPHMITETHVIIDVTGLSFFGVIMEMLFRPSPVQALVSLFYTPPFDDDHPSSILKVLLLPQNVVLSDVLKKRRELYGEEIYIGNPPCKLIPKQEYTLSTSPQDDSIRIQPNEAEFVVDQSSYHNYIETFDVILKRRFSSVSVLLRSIKTSDCPWEREVDLSAALRKYVQRTPSHEAEDELLSVRRRFIMNVSDAVLDDVLDELLGKRVISQGEYNAARAEKVKDEKARCVIDTVRRKGAGLELISILREIDRFLCEDLGWM